MTTDVERLLALLPAIYRIRDVQLSAQDQPGPLKALLAVIAEQLAILQEGLEQHYDDLFVETADPSLVPYIGELIGTSGVGSLPGSRFTERAFVANTIAYRRRKGTAAVLEQLAVDITGWEASVVEYFDRLATTQFLNHLRPNNLSFADVRDPVALEAVGTAFDRLARTADVRRIESLRGKYNIPNIGIFLYRLASFSATEVPALPVDAHRFYFDPLGRRVELYSKPELEREITHLAEPSNVPLPITRRTLHHDTGAYYGPAKSLSVRVDGTLVPLGDIIVCDLSDTATGWAHTPATKTAVDPVLGRLALPSSSTPPTSVRVTYHYGFSARIGGGEYEREESFIEEVDPLEVPSDRPTIQQGIDQAAGSPAVVQVASNDRFVEALAIAAGSGASGRRIEVRAANKRRPTAVTAGDWSVTGGDESEVTINGFLIGGAVRVPQFGADGQPNRLRVLRIRHCTLLPQSRQAIVGLAADPGGPRLIVEAPDVTIEIEHSIVGAVEAVDSAKVHIKNSVIDAGDETAAAYAALGGGDGGAPLTVENVTVIGTVRTTAMTLASNTIFLASAPGAEPVRAERLQEGCVRFSFVPPGSRLPLLHRCQPTSAADAGRVRPMFTSLTCGDAGYAQLAPQTAAEIRRGADDGSEMGALHDLFQAQRLAGLRGSLNEYLRFGLEAGIFLAS